MIDTTSHSLVNALTVKGVSRADYKEGVRCLAYNVRRLGLPILKADLLLDRQGHVLERDRDALARAVAKYLKYASFVAWLASYRYSVESQLELPF